MANPRATDDGLPIDAVAKLTGITAGQLRIWEYRWNWPSPGRLANGYRTYSPSVVPLLIRVRLLIEKGHSIGDILRDGVPTWPEGGPKRSAPTWSCLDQLPVSRGHESFRLRLVAAIRARNLPAIARAIHEAPIVLRPGERLVAAWLPAYFGAREWQRAGRPLERDVAAIIARVAGPVVVADLSLRWDTAEAIG